MVDDDDTDTKAYKLTLWAKYRALVLASDAAQPSNTTGARHACLPCKLGFIRSKGMTRLMRHTYREKAWDPCL